LGLCLERKQQGQRCKGSKKLDVPHGAILQFMANVRRHGDLSTPREAKCPHWVVNFQGGHASEKQLFACHTPKLPPYLVATDEEQRPLLTHRFEFTNIRATIPYP
jgi:hypothetical protein